MREKFKKTYAVPGKMEWYCQINSGDTFVKIPFTDGGISPYGVHPAEFTTSDEVVQCIIENSDYFTSGKIILQRAISMGMADDGAKSDAEKPEEPAAVEEKAEESKKVDVRNVTEAKDYLNDNGIDASSARRKDEIIALAKSKGIEFNWI